MPEPFETLEATYGPAAPFSEHKRGERIKYLRADGMASSGVIVWVQAAYQDIPIKYIIAPDDNGFLDFALPSDVLTRTRGSRSKWTGSNGKMMKQLVEPVHGYESQPQRVFEPSFSLCVSNDLKQPVVPIENMHTLNDLSLTLIPAHLLREPQGGASTCTAHSSVG